MNSGFTKLFSSIVTSSLWVEPDPILRVWIAMLATCDARGEVQGSIPGFASLCRITPDQMRECEEKLLSPDPESRTKTCEGRRIERVDGGWRIINYLAYREKGQDKPGSRAAYFREYRCITQQSNVARNIEAEAEAEADKGRSARGNGKKVSPSVQAILHDKELKRVEARMKTIRSQASESATGKSYSQDQKSELSKLRKRKGELLSALGMEC